MGYGTSAISRTDRQAEEAWQAGPRTWHVGMAEEGWNPQKS